MKIIVLMNIFMFSVMPPAMYGNKGIINIPFLRKRHGKNCVLIPMFQTRKIPNEEGERKFRETL